MASVILEFEEGTITSFFFWTLACSEASVNTSVACVHGWMIDHPSRGKRVESRKNRQGRKTRNEGKRNLGCLRGWLVLDACTSRKWNGTWNFGGNFVAERMQMARQFSPRRFPRGVYNLRAGAALRGAKRNNERWKNCRTQLFFDWLSSSQSCFIIRWLLRSAFIPSP